MSRTLSRGLVLALAAATLAIVVAALSFALAGSGVTVDDATAIVGALATALVGTLIVWAQPGNRLGWLYAALGAMIAMLPLVNSYSKYVHDRGTDPSTLLAWVAEWWWLPMLFSLLVFWLFLFPDGHLAGPRWRLPFGLAVGTCAVASVLAALDPTLDNDEWYEIANPIGVEGLHDVEAGASGAVLTLVFVASALAGAASLVVRFRRSSGAERAQIKWIVLGGLTVVCGFVVLGALSGLGVRVDWAYGLLFLVIPASLGLAILRQGLFDVDLVIRRTVVYGALSVLLVAAYAGLVLAGQAVLSSFAGGGDLAIAVSTLVIAALFLPLRARVQRFVDRRFYRRRYDAQRTLEAFGARLREQVELDGLRSDLEGVVRETMQPAYVSVWLRARDSVTIP